MIELLYAAVAFITVHRPPRSVDHACVAVFQFDQVRFLPLKTVSDQPVFETGSVCKYVVFVKVIISRNKARVKQGDFYKKIIDQ